MFPGASKVPNSFTLTYQALRLELVLKLCVAAMCSWAFFTLDRRAFRNLETNTKVT
jgi:hypothetical protein